MNVSLNYTRFIIINFMSQFQIKKIIRQADISRKQGKFSQALIFYNKVLPYYSNKDNNFKGNETFQFLKKQQIEKIMINKISCLIATFQYVQALKQCQRLIIANPRNFKVYYQKANILFLQKNYQDAIYQYSTAIRICQEIQYSSILLGLYKFNRGLSYQKLNNRKLCILDYLDAIKFDQNNEDYYVALASIYQEDNNIQQAYKVLSKILIINHQCYKVHKQYGKLLKSQGKYEESLKHFDQSIKILNKVQVFNKKEEISSLITSKIYLLKLMEKKQQALKSYDQLIQANSQASYYLNNKAVYLDMLDQHQQAIKIYDKILMSNPKYVEAHINKGNSLLRLKQYQNALNQFNQAIYKKQKRKEFISPLYYCHRALAYQKLNLQTAYDCYQRQENQINNFNSYMSSQNQKFVHKVLFNFSNMLKNIEQLQKVVNETSSRQYIERGSYNINQNSRQLQKNKVKRFKKDFIQNILESMHSKKQFEIIKFENQYQILKDQIKLLNQKNHKMQATILTLHKTKSQFNMLKGNIYEQNQKIELLSQRVNEIQKVQEEILGKFDCQFKKVESEFNKLKNLVQQFKKQQNKSKIVKYAQQMFWLLNAYFISFRILKTQLVKKDKPAWKSKIAKVLSLSKDAMSIFKQAPVVGTGFQIIQKISEIYLQSQCTYINEILYQFTISNFFGEDQINEFISKGIRHLIQSQYIQNRIKHQQDNLSAKPIEINMTKNMQIHIDKAKKWYQQKKKNIIKKISGVDQIQKYHLISQIVLEDIAQLFCYIIKIMPSQLKANKQNQQKSLTPQQKNIKPTTNIFQKVFIHQSLDEKLLKLYRKSCQKESSTDLNEGIRCKVCIIY